MSLAPIREGGLWPSEPLLQNNYAAGQHDLVNVGYVLETKLKHELVQREGWLPSEPARILWEELESLKAKAKNSITLGLPHLKLGRAYVITGTSPETVKIIDVGYLDSLTGNPHWDEEMLRLKVQLAEAHLKLEEKQKEYNSMCEDLNGEIQAINRLRFEGKEPLK